MSTATTPAQPPTPPRRRGMGTAKNMVWSTLAVTAMVLAFYALVVRPDRVERAPVDAVAVATDARRQTGWPLATMEGLGEGWSSTVARLAPGAAGQRTWQVRYVRGTTEYAAVAQTQKASREWLDAMVKGRTPGKPVTVGSVPVDTYTSGSACTLVHAPAGGLATVVETGAGCDTAAGLAAHLRPALR